MFPRLPWHVIRCTHETGKKSAEVQPDPLSLGTEGSRAGLRDEENRGHAEGLKHRGEPVYEVVSGPQASGTTQTKDKPSRQRSTRCSP